jgi:hypothetical protein
MQRRVKFMLGALGLFPVAGMVGAIDMEEQSYLDAAKVTTPAKRGAQYQMAVPTSVGLNGLPLAPVGLTDCQEAQFYRIQAGLPTVFDRLAKAESQCQNDVNSWCCYGIWQIHKLWVSQLKSCDIDSIDDYFGDNPLDKQRNACAARYVYNESGAGAWDTY